MSDGTQLHPQALRYPDRCAAQNAIQKILVIVDPTAATHPCIEKAARLASACGSSLEAFICDIEQGIPDSWAGGTTMRQYRDLVHERRIAQLESLARPLRARGLHVLTACERHIPIEEGIVRYAIRSKADFVVKDTHRHPPIRNAPTLQTDWILIRQIPVPLLLVRAATWPSHPRIGVAVDPCHPADRPLTLDETMIGTAGSLGRALTGRVEWLHALQAPPRLPGDGVSEAQRRIPEGILRLAEAAVPDVLVIGATSCARSQYSAASTASLVLDHVDCDVLIIKVPGFVSPALVTDG